MQSPEAQLRAPDGKLLKLLPNQTNVSADAVNDFVIKILNSKPGEFPQSVTTPGEKIQIDPGDGRVGAGHHRLIAATLASRLTGRPLYGGTNPIIPASEIAFEPLGAKGGDSWNAVRPDPRGSDGIRPALEKYQAQLAALRAMESSDSRSHQIAHTEWELRRAMEQLTTDLRNQIAEFGKSAETYRNAKQDADAAQMDHRVKTLQRELEALGGS